MRIDPEALVAAFVAALLVVFAVVPACAQPSANGSVPAALEPFDREMRAWIARFGVRHAGIAVMRGDGLVMAQGYGGRRANERIDVWSLSKAITATCIAALVAERKLGLHDAIGPLLSPLNDRYGAFADGRIERVTVADLLSHRGGFARRFSDNGFAPGLPALLQRVPPRAATAEMLLPDIARLELAHAPGAQYDYSNVGYLLLGQIIEARTGESYAQACGRRVLAKAGIRGATLDPTWGGVLQAAGGWSLSLPEYLAFLRLLRPPEKQFAVLRVLFPRRQDFLSPPLREWLTNGNDKWIERGKVAYTLGVLVRFPELNLFHGGAWAWRQRDAAEGPILVKEGTWSVLAGDGTAWVASFDTVNADEDPDATLELDRALWRARQAVATWPKSDLFASFGIGTVGTNQ